VFTIGVAFTGPGQAALGASVRSADATANSASGFIAVSPGNVIPNARIPAGTVLSFPFAAALGNPVFIFFIRAKVNGHKVILLTLINTSGATIFGRLVLLGVTPKQFNTGLTVGGASALDVFLPPHSTVPVQLPLLSFTPVLVAGF
jgi:hypothetical protein